MYLPNLTDLLWVRKEVTYFLYPNLSLNQQLIHAVFTRHGGVSDPPFDSLNASYTVGDRPQDVTINIGKIKKVIKASHLIFMKQSHGDNILVLRQGHFDTRSESPSADAMITNIPRIALMVKQADCQGVIIFDPKRGVIANIHCGWRGNVHNILGSVLTRMKEAFGCKASDLLAAIGPSLGPCCAEFVSHEEIFPEVFDRCMVRENYFDLWAISYWQLMEAGVRAENIEVAGICTRCKTDLFYSYRGERKTGRFGTIAMLRSG
jgi:YfiH family protein